ncbi:hypothetical protein GCM10011309_25340 [Litorimonas cladophorae]|uniref:TadE-like domain-containing protein n=1 Tax=Litorimonas cladophorae TaxID=1220491 RepID=A0A918KUK2_9PROT|nr:TadE/TadG family type IV pilus assembly protein [Litorimonas cladophorae]GGX74134.1 hypothetical protein GCM10011309_25340 [Litorimonas cladophorae]
MKHLFDLFRKSESGSVTVETSLIIMLLIMLTGGTIEASFAFHQYNAAQQAARTGVRIAATSDPVSRDFSDYTNVADLSLERHCSSDTQQCSGGQYDSNAMRRIIFGPDGDGACAATTRSRRGMCDVFSDTQRAHVDVSYIGSGLGRTGAQGDAAPIVSVTLRDIPLNFVFLDLVGFKDIVHLPPVEATLMGEDLKNG